MYGYACLPWVLYLLSGPLIRATHVKSKIDACVRDDRWAAAADRLQPERELVFADIPTAVRIQRASQSALAHAAPLQLLPEPRHHLLLRLQHCELAGGAPPFLLPRSLFIRLSA